MTPVPLAQRLACPVDQALQISGLGRTTLYSLMKSGRLETMTVGKRRLVLIRSLIALIDPKAATPTSGAQPPPEAA